MPGSSADQRQTGPEIFSSLYDGSCRDTLDRIDMSNNRIRANAEEDLQFVSTLPHLAYFSVAGNNYFGHLPSMGYRSRLVVIDLSDNPGAGRL